MKNIVIKNENPKMGKEIINFFDKLGFNTSGYQGFNSEELAQGCIYYGVINDIFANWTLDEVDEYDAEIITLPTQFKRGDKVLVWDDCEDYYRCVDFVTYVEGSSYPYCVSDDITQNSFHVAMWKNCKHAPQKVKLTLQEIADKFNINVDLIEIV